MFSCLKDVNEIIILHKEVHSDDVYFSEYFDYFTIKSKEVEISREGDMPAAMVFMVYLQFLDKLFKELVKPTKVVGSLLSPDDISYEKASNFTLRVNVPTLLHLAELVKASGAEEVILSVYYKVKHEQLIEEWKKAYIYPDIFAVIKSNTILIEVKLYAALSTIYPLYVIVFLPVYNEYLNSTFTFDDLVQSFHKMVQDVKKYYYLHTICSKVVCNNKLIERAVKMGVVRNILDVNNGSIENVKSATFKLRHVLPYWQVIRHELQFLQQSNG